MLEEKVVSLPMYYKSVYLHFWIIEKIEFSKFWKYCIFCNFNGKWLSNELGLHFNTIFMCIKYKNFISIFATVIVETNFVATDRQTDAIAGPCFSDSGHLKTWRFIGFSKSQFWANRNTFSYDENVKINLFPQIYRRV